MIKGIIYDLDGTIIDTEIVHQNAWKHAASTMRVEMSPDMLISQRGRTDIEFARSIIPALSPEDIEQFIKEKREFVLKNLGSAPLFKGFAEALELLRNKNISVAICTSAGNWFVDEIIKEHPILRLPTVTSEMVKKGKPDPEPLFLSLKMIGLNAYEGIYVGDAYNDYLAAKAARVKFVHFGNLRDARLPKEIPGIVNHLDVMQFM